MKSLRNIVLAGSLALLGGCEQKVSHNEIFGDTKIEVHVNRHNSESPIYTFYYTKNELEIFQEEGITEDTMKDYLSAAGIKLSAHQIRRLRSAGYAPVFINEFIEMFAIEHWSRGHFIDDLIRQQGSLESHNPEKKFLNPILVAQLHEALGKPRDYSFTFDAFLAGLTPEIVREYKEAGNLELPHNAGYVVALAQNKFLPEDIKKYGTKNIDQLEAINDNELFKQAREYGHAFKKEDVRKLHDNKVTPEDAKKYVSLNDKYWTKISADDIVFYTKNNVTFATVEQTALEEAIRQSLK